MLDRLIAQAQETIVDRSATSEGLAREIEAALGDRDLVVGCAVLDSTRIDVPLPFVSVGLDIPDHLVTKQKIFDLAVGASKTIIQSAYCDQFGGVELHFRKKSAASRTLANPFGRIARLSITHSAYAGVDKLRIDDLTTGSPYPGIGFALYDEGLS